MWRTLSSSALFACVVVGAGCGQPLRTVHRYDAPGEQLILAEDIAASGATTAWEVVRGMTHMSTSTTASGEPSRMWRRGRGSIYGSETPIVVVDGVESLDIQILAQIRADRIAWIRILTSTASAARFGTDGGGGAVIVQTIGADQDVASRH